MLISALSALKNLYSSGRIIELVSWGTPGIDSQASYPPLYFPQKSSADSLVYGLNLSSWLGDEGELLATDAVTITPTGNQYDITAGIPFIIDDNTIACVLSSGQLGYRYSILFTATTTTGKRASFNVNLFVNFDSVAMLPPAAGGLVMAVCSSLTATGTTISDAFQMQCQYNVFGTIPLGSGGKLPPYPGPTPITVVNPLVAGNDLLVYPPDTASSINGLALGAPVLVPAPITAGEVSESTFIFEDPTHILAF